MSDLVRTLRDMHNDLEHAANMGAWTEIDGRFGELLRAADKIERLTARLKAESGEVDKLVDRLQQSEDESGRLTAENERLRKTGKDLRDDMRLRALLRATDGDIVIKASASRWEAFCNALESIDDT